MEFIEAPAFTRYLADYLNDEAYKELQAKLAANPQLGDLMPGTGGFRKLRWADVRRGKGRRGGLRIIYYHFRSVHFFDGPDLTEQRASAQIGKDSFITI